MSVDSLCTSYGIVPLIKLIRTIFLTMEIIVPIIAILFLTKIFIEAMANGEEKDIKKAINKSKNLFIALGIIFFIPVIISASMHLGFMKDEFDIAECWDAANLVDVSYDSSYIDTHKDKKKSVIDNPSDYQKGKEKKEEKTENKSSSSKNSSNDKEGKAGYSSTGKVHYLTKNGKNWNLNSYIQYTLNQGATSDGTYIYVVFKGDDSHGVVAKYDLERRMFLKKSEVMNLGHANDITYDYKRRKLFVTRRETNDLSVVMIDPNTFSHKTVNINIPRSLKGANVGAIKAFNGIAYDKSSSQLLIRGRYANSQLIYVNDNFKATKVLHIRKWFDIPTQGMELVNNKVIYSQSLLQYRSSVTSYSKSSGKKLQSTSLGVHGELEGVFYHNGYLYGVTYDKRGNNKTLIYVIDKAYY